MKRDKRELEEADWQRSVADDLDNALSRRDEHAHPPDDPLTWFVDEAAPAPPVDHAAIESIEPEVRATSAAGSGLARRPQAEWGAGAGERLRTVDLPSTRWSVAALALAFVVGIGLSTWILQLSTRSPGAPETRSEPDAADVRSVPAPEPTTTAAPPAPSAATPDATSALTRVARPPERAVTPARRPAAGRLGEGRTAARSPRPTVTTTDLPSEPLRTREPAVSAVEAAPRPPAPTVLEPAAPAPILPVPDPVAVEEVAVRRTLDDYLTASAGLDVNATAQVWPSVNRQALARAFATLKSQAVRFDACDLDVTAAAAVARCRGVLQFVRKVGSPTPRVAPQQWTFRMRKVAGGWQIDDVVAAPAASAAAITGTKPAKRRD